MNILFLDCTPEADLAEELAEQGLSIQIEDDPKQGDPQSDIVVWQISKVSQLKRVRALRAQFPESWIAVIVPDAWLEDPDAYADILSQDDKNDTWIQSQWQTGFWLGVQRAIAHRLMKEKVADLQEEINTLQEEQNEVLQTSRGLVSQFESDLQLMSDLHRRLYPRFSPDVPGVQVWSKYLPASGTGGDYFDIIEFADKRRFGLLIADSDSHRAAADLLSLLLGVRQEEISGKFANSAVFMEHLNAGLTSSQKAKTKPLRLLYGIFDRATLRFDLTIAGDMQAYLVRSGQCETLDQDNPPLGVNKHTWKSVTHELNAGDTLFFHTNGLTAALGKKDVRTVVEDLEHNADPHAVRNELLARIETQRAKKPLPDDTTFVLLCVDSRAMFLRPTGSLPQSK